MKNSISLWFCLYIGIFSMLYSVKSTAQKELGRTYFGEGITTLNVDANGVHALRLNTGKVEDISVEVYLEGETSEEIVIKEQRVANQLTLGFGFWPFATRYNDKLAAHKILSVEVVLLIPENLSVSVTSNSSAIIAEGVFDFLHVDIEDKNCELQNFTGNASLQTNKGAILVWVQNAHTFAKAKTTYGTTENTLNTVGTFIISAESIHGDISLQQTQ